MKKIIICSLFSLFLLSLSSTSWAVIDLSSYFEPEMNDGYTWTYIENGLNYVTETVLPGVTYLNSIAYKAEKTSGGEQSGSVAYYWLDSTGYTIARVFVPDIFVSGYGFVDGTEDFIPPAKFPTYVNEGDMTTLSGNMNLSYSGFGTYLFRYTYSFKIVGFENITVPFGNYDALKIQTELKLTGYIDGQYASITVTGTSWSVPHIGVIKEDIVSVDQNISRELVSINFSVPSSDRPPTGYVDYVGETEVAGWAYDPDDPNQSIDVHVYIDGNIVGSANANLERPDLGFSYAYHGFWYNLPELSPGTHSINVYAINLDPNGSNPLLPGATNLEISPAPSPNENATFDIDSGILHIPIVKLNSETPFGIITSYYKVDLQLVGESFTLYGAEEITPEFTDTCATFDAGSSLLHVPKVDLEIQNPFGAETITYEVDLRFLQTGVFDIANVSIVE